MENQEILNKALIPKIMSRFGLSGSKAKKFAKHILLPRNGMIFNLNGLIYKVTYVRQDPYRFTAEPVGIVDHDPKKKEKKPSWIQKIGKSLKKT